ncbi:retrovirus-related pol polyprotein from transposon TNT 1-94 [Tanacetum coccineum]
MVMASTDFLILTSITFTLLSKKDVCDRKAKFVSHGLCGPLRSWASINGEEVYSGDCLMTIMIHLEFFLRSRKETPEASPRLSTIDSRILQLRLLLLRTDRGTGILNKIHAISKKMALNINIHPQTPEQNGVVERRNRTLVEAARTMLLASKLPLSFWAEAVCKTALLILRTESIIISLMKRRHITIINDRKLQ